MSDTDLLGVLESFSRARVLVFGDVILDRFIYGSVERMSPEAPVPVMTIERSSDLPGGAANVARNVAGLGGHAVLVGVVGTDEAAERLRERLAEAPAVRAQLVIDAARPTTLKTRYIGERQQILRTDVESRSPLPESVAAAALAQFHAALAESHIVVLSDYAKGVLCDGVVAEAIAAARAAGKQVLVDPKSRSFTKYKGTTILTPNRHELQGACGHDCSSDEQVVAGAREILAQGICSTLVVTRGKDGMSVVRDDGTATHIRTQASEVYEVTGAGDTAVAALAVGLAGGADIGEAVRLANTAAGIVVGKFGIATVTAGEILEQLDDAHASRVRFALNTVQRLVHRWRQLGLRVAFTNGCFDLLHPGHLSLLTQAKRTADRLVVGLNSDLSTRRLKGPGRPVQSAMARAMVLTSLKAVDAVVIFEEDTPRQLIAALEPDVLVKGADYTVENVVGADMVLARGGRVVLADLVPLQSTTNTIRRIARVGKA
ncbi:MAG TPA: D-glycero-beta-D-manno-heptose-7-phosphate kinase [Steroidobacteraceae bacterium]|nr:D-glycero-beta-D-manno-heptose-7-phosphate kinase [Steroidobacteraceae bacterium]